MAKESGGTHFQIICTHSSIVLKLKQSWRIIM